MSRKTKVVIVTCSILLVSLLFLFLYNLNVDNKNYRVETNEGITKIENFSISSKNTDLLTSVDGTVFYNGTQASAQIIASFYIDPQDWGGVAFYFPSGWQISGVKSSYPQGNQEIDPYGPVTILSTVDETVKWATSLEIARDFISASKHSGGYGTIVIDLSYKNEQPQNALKFAVNIGSKVKNGFKITGTDTVEINLE